MAIFESRLKSDHSPGAFKELFVRHENNPVLSAKDWPYPVNTVFNPAATSFEGKTLLLARVEDRRGFSHLTKAISANGIDNWQIDPQPTFYQSLSSQSEQWGVEDPRITYLDELNKYAVVYTGFSSVGPVVNMALTDDFVNFERMGTMMPPDDKDAALFPRKFGDKWLMIHRPVQQGAHIWLSSSENLHNWGDHRILINSRGGCWWDGPKVGLNTPPLETPEGWLILYHGVRLHAGGAIYRLGLAMLDLDDPMKVIHRGDEWIFNPSTSYEHFGDVHDVVYPCGWVWDKDTNKLRMYYGAADTCIGLATANMSDIISYITSCPPSYSTNNERRNRA